MFSGYGHFNFFYRIWDKLRIKFSDIVMKHSYKKCTKYELDCNNIRENKRLFRYINQEKKNSINPLKGRGITFLKQYLN